MSYPKERKLAFRVPKKSLVTEKRYYVYVLCDPRKSGMYNYTLPDGKTATFSNRPFYVGKGTGTRSTAHIREAMNANSYSGGYSHKVRTIRKIIREGYTVDIKVCKPRFEEATAFEYEMMLIAVIGRHDLKTGPLTNHTDGGEGTSGSTQSAETRAKKSQSMIGKNVGKKHTRATKREMSRTRKGRKVAPETTAQIIATKKANGYTHSATTRRKIGLKSRGRIPKNKGVPMSEEQKAKLRKPVCLEGTVYSGVLEAAQLSGRSPTYIYRLLKSDTHLDSYYL